MGTIRKKGVAYEAAVARRGVRKSATFRTKGQAAAWVVDTEREILQGRYNTIPDKTFGDLMRRYGREVSPGKRGGAWELKRIGKLLDDPLGQVRLDALSAAHFADWRDRRLVEVTAATVLRDWNLISHALNIAVKEWGWLPDNPIKGVRKPRPPEARSRRISQDEIDRLLLALGYQYDARPVTVTARVGAALLFAIETAMRAGEIASLTWDNVNLSARVAHLPMTKNGFARDVPLSGEAVRILQQVRQDGVVSVFDLRPSQIDALFRKCKKRAMVEDLHFHDSRAEAITRLAQRVDILTLARISGHRDLRQLQIYYRESVEDIARRL